MALHGVNLLIARQLVVDVERFMDRHRSASCPPLCPVSTQPVRLLERHRADRTARCVSTRAWLARGGLDHKGIPFELPAHTHEVI